MTDEWYEVVTSVVTADAVKRDEPMAQHTTFRIGGPADIYVSPASAEMVPLVRMLISRKIPWIALGNGSNVLVGDRGIRGVVIGIGSRMNQITVDGCEVTAEAGALLSAVARAAAAKSLTGLEFAAGIPGSIGGGVMMNAGAYGGSIDQVITEVRVLAPEGEEKFYSGDEMNFGYRHSRIMEEGGLVLSAKMRLTEGDPETIRGTMRDLAARRSDKQPLTFPSAGSTFKRPTGYFAGKLIQDAGLGGYTVGGAQVSEKHCGFVINRGGATAQDVRQLMEDVTRIVREKSGVTLEPEVRMIGEF